MSKAHILIGHTACFVERTSELHSEYYRAHWGFGARFQTVVESEMSEFLGRYDESCDRIWCVTVDNRIEGSLTIDGIDAQGAGAHLRWFITSSAVRGQGVGEQLINEAMNFCRMKGFPGVYLWTFRGLEAARHLYEKVGFRLVETRPGTRWGTKVDEQRYEVSFAHDG